MIKGNFAVIGGDMRSAYLAEMLACGGTAVRSFGLELSGVVAPSHIYTLTAALEYADYIILPIPLLDGAGRPVQTYSKERFTLTDVISKCKKDAVLLAGMVTQQARQLCENLNHRILDYYERDDIRIMNAVPAALIKRWYNHSINRECICQ